MPPTSTRAYLYPGPMDMRRSIDAQALFIEAAGTPPFCGETFGFFNSRLHKAKLMWWGERKPDPRNWWSGGRKRQDLTP